MAPRLHVALTGGRCVSPARPTRLAIHKESPRKKLRLKLEELLGVGGAGGVRVACSRPDPVLPADYGGGVAPPLPADFGGGTHSPPLPADFGGTLSPAKPPPAGPQSGRLPPDLYCDEVLSPPSPPKPSPPRGPKQESPPPDTMWWATLLGFGADEPPTPVPLPTVATSTASNGVSHAPLAAAHGATGGAGRWSGGERVLDALGSLSSSMLALRDQRIYVFGGRASPGLLQLSIDRGGGSLPTAHFVIDGSRASVCRGQAPTAETFIRMPEALAVEVLDAGAAGREKVCARVCHSPPPIVRVPTHPALCERPPPSPQVILKAFFTGKLKVTGSYALAGEFARLMHQVLRACLDLFPSAA